ncbi:MAG: ATP-binding protein [Pyrinomonadaceae bacterium]|nr:ATP-binding protein [Pyrinomonadaceae bacterium]
MSGSIFERTATDPGMLAGQNFAETVYWQSSRNSSVIVGNAIKESASGQKTELIVDFRVSVDEKVPIQLTFVPAGEPNDQIFVAGRIVDAERLPGSASRRGGDELLHAAANADIGLWYWDFLADEIFSTPQCNELLGLPAYEALTVDRILDSVHPDDRAAVRDLLAETRRSGRRYEEEFRVIYPDGEVEWICAEGKSMLDPEGHPVKMMGVLRKTTDQKLAAEELARVYDREKKARDEAVEANRAKDFFLALVSHELRAPLNAILGWSKILLTKDVDEKTRRNALETIERSASSQAKLINDLVDSARVASGRLRLEYRPTNLYELVRGSCQAMEPAAGSRGIALDFSADRSDVVVFGDANRLQQVFGNIISNAIKFTPEGGRVGVTITANDATAQISVEDNGQGISPDSLPGIFRQFSQGELNQNRGSTGLGLGLSIAKILAERHGGTIDVESKGIGEGSKFTVTLPLTHPDQRVAETHLETKPVRRPLEGITMLIVEDDPDSREVLTLFLEQNGAKVTAATNARTAFSALNGFTNGLPDVIISDLAMPEEDGYSLISRIRSLEPEKGGTIPALALSAFATEESRTKAFEAGFQRYSTKPFEPDLLVREVLNLVNDKAKAGA